ncbi:MAG: hypothetical protein HN909_05870 [Phycisphaerales bacterium]|jgi:hypothetical protein|nr:hypothetical protein [Phycisphaerales bacterium]
MSVYEVSDDFFVNANIQTTLPLPDNRETVLQFFEAIQREFPTMTTFLRRESGEFVLEGDREERTYPWIEVHRERMCMGYFNPPDLDTAYQYHHWILKHCVYYIGLSGLDIELQDLMYGFNLDYVGNRDELVATALMGDAPLGRFAAEQGVKNLEFQPSYTFSLDEDCYQQARVMIETRSTHHQVRTGRYESDPISVFFTLRQYPQPGRVRNILETFDEQSTQLEDWTIQHLLPQVLRPIAETITTRP